MAEIYIIIMMLECVWIVWLLNRPNKHSFDFDTFLKAKKLFDENTSKYDEDIRAFSFKSLEVVFENDTISRVKKITLKKN